MVALAVALSGCTSDPLDVTSPARAAGTAERTVPRHASSGAPESRTHRSNISRERPAPKRVEADLLVTSDRPLASETVDRLRHAHGVTTAAVLGMASAAVAGQTVSVAAVGASSYRTFTSAGTAEADGVWQAAARGEAIVAHAAAHDLDLRLGGDIPVGGARLRIGAFATTVPGVDVVVDRAVGDHLGVPRGNAVLLAAAGTAPAKTTDAVRDIVDGRAAVQVLTPPPSPGVEHRAFLTGSKAARRFGTFSYRYSSDGTIRADPAWVADNIRTESVPILGRVTCHRLMFPQLRGALREVERRGLADAIHPGEYGGCYVPRFIDRDPNRSISLHTWGIAIDLNVPENQRGTRGRMDRRIVAIFKEWGFAWGGDWSWTDPMHFELAGLLEPPG